jgi:ornithine carbamoyltransferase
VLVRGVHHATSKRASVVDIPPSISCPTAHPTQAVADFLTLRELLGTLKVGASPTSATA